MESKKIQISEIVVQYFFPFRTLSIVVDIVLKEVGCEEPMVVYLCLQGQKFMNIFGKMFKILFLAEALQPMV